MKTSIRIEGSEVEHQVAGCYWGLRVYVQEAVLEKFKFCEKLTNFYEFQDRPSACQFRSKSSH